MVLRTPYKSGNYCRIVGGLWTVTNERRVLVAILECCTRVIKELKIVEKKLAQAHIVASEKVLPKCSRFDDS